MGYGVNMNRLSFVACGLMLVLQGGSLFGCASDSRQDSPRQSEVRRDSDRFFDRMKDDERARQSGKPERSDRSAY
jgi:hypothetical protein